MVDVEVVGDCSLERHARVIVEQHLKGGVVATGIFSGHSDEGEVPTQQIGRVQIHGAQIDERADLEQRSPVAKKAQRRSKTGRITGCVDHEIDPAWNQTSNGVGSCPRVGRCHQTICRSEIRCDVETSGEGVDGYRPTGSPESGLGGMNQTNGSGPDDRDRVAGPKAGWPGHLCGQIEASQDTLAKWAAAGSKSPIGQ